MLSESPLIASAESANYGRAAPYLGVIPEGSLVNVNPLMISSMQQTPEMDELESLRYARKYYDLRYGSQQSVGGGLGITNPFIEKFLSVENMRYIRDLIHRRISENIGMICPLLPQWRNAEIQSDIADKAPVYAIYGLQEGTLEAASREVANYWIETATIDYRSQLRFEKMLSAGGCLAPWTPLDVGINDRVQRGEVAYANVYNMTDPIALNWPSLWQFQQASRYDRSTDVGKCPGTIPPANLTYERFGNIVHS